jgi:hypothetical protein
MTALPAEVHPFTPAAIQRSADHHYTFDGKTYPGVTGILKVLDKSGPLMAWAARQTAEAVLGMIELGPTVGEFDTQALKQLIHSVGPEGFIKAVTSRSSWKRDEAANLGTEVHALADLVVNAQPTPPMPEPVRLRVLKYADWWKASGWTLRVTEAMVVNRDGYGGTFDLLAYDRERRTVLADIKTGNVMYRGKLYDSIPLQIAAYGMAEFVAPIGSPVAYPMPDIDRYVVLHVTTEGVQEIDIDITDRERLAFFACLSLSEWINYRKGKKP